MDAFGARGVHTVCKGYGGWDTQQEVEFQFRWGFWADIQKGIPFMTWTVKTGVLLIAQIHGYLLGLKSIKTLIVGLQKI